MDTTEYKWVGEHPQDVASGQFLGVGDIVEFTQEDVRDPHNHRLIESGLLIKQPKAKDEPTKKEDDK